MDHFNATVQNGTLVSTRRGLQVTKTKHQGTRFVNSFAITPASAKGKTTAREPHDGFATVDLGKPLETRFKFVTKPREKARSASSALASGSSAAGTATKGKATKDKEDDESRRQNKLIVRRNAAAPPPRPPQKQPEQPSRSRAQSISQPSTTVLSEDSPQSILSRWQPKAQATHTQPQPPGFRGDEKFEDLIHLYFKVVPTKMYPLEELLEYNPVRTHTFFERAHRDLVTMHCVVMSAALVESVIVKGERCSKEMSYYIGKVCNMVNGALQVKNRGIQQPLLECVVAMAICGTYIGRYDHWHLHMRGLKKMIEVFGGLRPDMGYCLNKVRRGDVKGAAVIGALPYLDYPRFFDLVSDRLPLEERARIADQVTTLLQPAGIQNIVITSFVSLTKFARIITVARHDRTRSLKFDPDAFIEEWYWVEYQLVRYPGPLRDEESLPSNSVEIPSDPDAMGELSDDESSIDLEMHQLPTSPSRTASLTTGTTPSPSPQPQSPVLLKVTDFTFPLHRNSEQYVPPSGLRPAPSDSLLEPAVRIAGVLYIEELIPDEPRTLNAYTTLLALLNYQVRVITDALRRRQLRTSFSSMGMSFTPGEDEGMDWEMGDGLPSTAVLRPIVIWVCVMGYIMARISASHFALGRADKHDRSAYCECLIALVGPAAEFVDRLTDQDLEMLRMLSIRQMGYKGGWTDNEGLKDMIREGMLSEYVTPPLTP